MELFVTKVPRSLETRPKIFGLELADVLVLMLYLSISNLIFGGTVLKFPLVWGGTVVFALTLFFSKRGKPENYLQHLGEYMTKPIVYSAAAPDTAHVPFRVVETGPKEAIR